MACAPAFEGTIPMTPSPIPSFTPRERDLLRALAAALLPDNGIDSCSHTHVDYLSFAQRYVADAPPHMRRQVKRALLAMDWLGWAWCGAAPQRFGKLTIEQRTRLIDAWRDSRRPMLRRALQAVSHVIMEPWHHQRIQQALSLPAQVTIKDRPAWPRKA